ncbi:hypothetical protein [Sphingobium sp. CR28]|uniref:hypothetical protein n=1 Tax=Sphingobium sp. CR28 TaxID=3400272 RepID=UPI003FEED83A
MSRLVSSRKRLLRVRHVQHSQAVAEVMRARDEVSQLSHNADRISRVRAELFETAEHTTGAAFAAQRELATRLERAGRQIDGAIYDARRRVDETDARRLHADRDREVAERLTEQAKAAREAAAEARLSAIPRYRRMQSKETSA